MLRQKEWPRFASPARLPLRIGSPVRTRPAQDGQVGVGGYRVAPGATGRPEAYAPLPLRMRLGRVEQSQMRMKAAGVVREQALIASPLNFGCDAAIFWITLRLRNRSARIVLCLFE